MAGNRATLLIMAGDGIGPEVLAESRRIAEWFILRRGLAAELTEELFGLAAYRKHGRLLREDALARMRAALRHATRNPDDAGESTFSLGDLHVDLPKRQVSVAGHQVHLTPIEYRLLTTLIRHAGKVLTHRQLLLEVWGPPYADQAHYLRVYMAQLRRKLEVDPARPRYLLTEPGVGYRLAAD